MSVQLDPAAARPMPLLESPLRLTGQYCGYAGRMRALERPPRPAALRGAAGCWLHCGQNGEHSTQTHLLRMKNCLRPSGFPRLKYWRGAPAAPGDRRAGMYVCMYITPCHGRRLFARQESPRPSSSLSPYVPSIGTPPSVLPPGGLQIIYCRFVIDRSSGAALRRQLTFHRTDFTVHTARDGDS